MLKLGNKLFAQVNHSAQALNYLSLFYGKSNIKGKGMFLGCVCVIGMSVKRVHCDIFDWIYENMASVSV